MTRNRTKKSKHVYFFGDGKADGNSQLKNLLGGKGANLAEMAGLGLPVPPGFTITTEVCTHYYDNKRKYLSGLREEVDKNLAKIESAMSSRFGDPSNPLLVSVRSGARASMPGMMDTILNLGINDEIAKGVVKLSGDERFAFDCYRRFIQMYSDVVLEVDKELFEHRLAAKKKQKGVKLDTDLKAVDWKALVEEFKSIVQEKSGHPFPQDPHEQLWGAIGAVFRSWMNKRAIEYRRINNIPAHWGTAVNVQAMVFGNLGRDCATGVAFTRDPSTGDRVFFGEYLINAQGEDVVAGIRTPQPINIIGKKRSGVNLPSMEETLPDCYHQLEKIYQKLEKHYRDMQDIEFTIQKKKVWMLQTRNGKRTSQAAVKIAVDMVKEKLISMKEALLRIDANQLSQLVHPTLDPKAPRKVIAKGLPASPGAATGMVVFTADEAVAEAEAGKSVILVRTETSPEDIHGMNVAKGILTARGGMTCISGDTQVLTDRGLIKAERVFGLFEDGQMIRILTFDSRIKRPCWRQVVAVGRRSAEVIPVSVSQTGRAEENILRLTSDHKILVIQKRRLTKKRLDEVLAHQDFVTVVDQIPPSTETVAQPALAYLAGAIFSDGYIKLTPTKGSVTFIQKPTPEKAEFITAVERAFEQVFDLPFSYLRERETVSVLRGRTIRGSVEDRICFRREPASRLMEIRDNLSAWVLTLDRTALLHFLAGFIDGDGTYAEESSMVRVQISVSATKMLLLEGIALACLRLGIVPQITPNRDNYAVQIVEQVDEILAFSHRVRADIPIRLYESKCLAVRSLFDDIVEQVNFMGRVREGIKRNLMFGVEKIRRDFLPLCPGNAYQETESVLNAPLRSYRIKQIGQIQPDDVYNFEVDAADEIDKNFVVFSSRMTPVLVSNSHAAVVARGMGKCCVAGCGELHVEAEEGRFSAGDLVVKKGEWITLDGSAGTVMLGKIPTVEPTLSGDFSTIMKWADQYRKLDVRTNADTPRDSKVARGFGAEGIGLCRTEHMFFDAERIDAVREMILADTPEARGRALEKILPMQKNDFKEIFRVMNGLPVTIRLLDPPLHEFLPHTEEEITELAAKIGASTDKLRKKNEYLKEFNPMLGHRGCRLGVTFPEIYDMQVKAIMEAACELAGENEMTVIPEIMIPLVGHVKELELLRKNTVEVAERVIEQKQVKMKYTIGTMIELPRAAVTADQIAKEADFFSFGTNDLTQTTFGLSRDDAHKFLPFYVEHHLLEHDPFVVLDAEGVGAMIRMAVEKGRGVKPALKVGICGEHGGEPISVAFCHEAGLNYVSCSPYRVPVARLAAAQAALRQEESRKKRKR